MPVFSYANVENDENDGLTKRFFFTLIIGRRYNRDKKKPHRPVGTSKGANFTPLKTSERLAKSSAQNDHLKISERLAKEKNSRVLKMISLQLLIKMIIS